ncbi:MAG: hypothetical protein PHU85_07765 [Phycisphaerae bacterium]|nr:hypothetical protein [Phycisphaerae bacterium]
MRRPRFRRVAWTLLLALVTASGALADTVYLVGGGSYKGKARIEGDRVVVEIPGGAITLDRESVLRIEPGDDLATKLADMRAQLNSKDAEGHYRLGVWAVQNGLPVPARELFLAALRIQPDHVQAQLALGRVFLDGAWLDSETLQDMVRGWLAADLNEAALQVGRQSLAGMLPTSHRRVMLELTATAARRLGYFTEALADYRELGLLLVPHDPQAERVAIIADVLRDNPSGLYLVQVDDLTQAVARGGADEPPPSGFGSLADDDVLEWALRDKAKEMIAAGANQMTAAQGLLVTEPAKAAGVYRQAEDLFAKADAVNPGIARSYRVEIRRRLIQMHQSAAEAVALRFDGLIKTINNKSLPDYKTKLRSALSLLDDIQKELDQILVLGSPYPQELSLLISWTQEDLTTVKAMRRTMEGELERIGPGRGGTP